MTSSSSAPGPFDFAVIGGGIVGLATARALLRRFPGKSLVLLEKEPGLAAHQTGNNSGVIHSGLYYKPGSAKARLCVKGISQLKEFCEQNGVPYSICGKVVVAIDESEIPRLEELQRRGLANGIPVIERISPERLRELEPHAAGVTALHIPSTGIVDYRVVSAKLGEDVRRMGGDVRTGAELLGAREASGELVLETAAGAMRVRHAVNCAGLQCDRVARLLGARPEIKIVPFRGEYYKLRPEREKLVNALIYPVPDPAFPFLGVHFTRMAKGGVEAGPNAVLALRREGYRKTDFDLGDMAEMVGYSGFRKLIGRHWRTGMGEMHRSWSRPAFVRALRRLLPELTEADLAPGGAGIRAQAVAPDGRTLDDFHFLTHGRALHVLNAPSPGATASLAIADVIVDEADRVFGR